MIVARISFRVLQTCAASRAQSVLLSPSSRRPVPQAPCNAAEAPLCVHLLLVAAARLRTVGDEVYLHHEWRQITVMVAVPGPVKGGRHFSGSVS
eukprot:scaffold2097_cov403-Prasinococcus_capsulatus_cf.AAC.4